MRKFRLPQVRRFGTPEGHWGFGLDRAPDGWSVQVYRSIWTTTPSSEGDQHAVGDLPTQD